MAFLNVDSLVQGNLLQTLFTNNVRNQLSADFRDFEYVNKLRDKRTAPRDIKFMFQNSYGSAAVGFRNPGSTSGFPRSSKASVSEKTAYMKEMNATIEVDASLLERGAVTAEKYMETLALETQSKAIASKRLIAAFFQGDGTGVVGTATSVSDTSGANGKAVVTLTTTWSATLRGHVGIFEEGDLYICKQADGTARTPTVTGTFYAWKCTVKDRDNGKVTLQAVDSTEAVLPLTASLIAATDVFYRISQATFPDLTGTITDYGTATEVMAGLQSLAASDARTVWGITMSGSTAGSRKDAGGNDIDLKYVQAALDGAKLKTGGTFKYKLMSMAPETQSAMINARESDRRFVTADDNKRGVKFIAFQHGNDLLECYTSEFVRKDQIWMLPESSQGDKVLSLYGTDFKVVQPAGSPAWNLKPASGGGHDNAAIQYMKAFMTIVCHQPAAIASVDNFTIPAV